MRPLRGLTIVTCLAASVVCATRVSAQSRDIDIPSYWKALNEAPTIEAALTVPQPAVTDARAKELTGGLQRLRKYEFTMDRTDALVAVTHLEKAVRLSPNDAFAHFALGAALARGSDMRLRPYAQRSSYKPGVYSMAALRAPQELLRALELDPKFDMAALELAQVSLDLADPKLMSRSLELLADALRRKDAMAVFMSARLETRLNNPGRAMELGGEAEMLGFDPSMIALERVIALARMKAADDLIAEAYFDGIKVLSDAGAERYFAGVVQLASNADIEVWRRADLAEKRAWLRRFWSKRAAVAGQPAARQIAQLYQKLNRAYDIRGMTVIGGRPEEPHRRTLLGLIAPRVQVGDTTCIPTSVARCPIDASNLEAASLRPAVLAFDTLYAKPVIMAWEALQFRLTPEGGSQVVGAIQVLPQSVRALANRNGIVDATLMISVTDTMTDSISHASTSIRFERPVNPNASVLLGISVPAPPVRHAMVRVGIEDASHVRGASAGGEIDVERFDPDSLSMSDVILSPADSTHGSFERGAVHVSLAPGRIYRTGEVPTLYYEVYGLKEGETYTTRIELQPVDSGIMSGIRAILGRHPVISTFAFNDIAITTPIYGTQQVRQLQLTNVKPGYYAAQVVVTDSRGRTTSRERLVEVRE